MITTSNISAINTHGYICYDGFHDLYIHGYIVGILLNNYICYDGIMNEANAEFLFMKFTKESVYLTINNSRYYNSKFVYDLLKFLTK